MKKILMTIVALLLAYSADAQGNRSAEKCDMSITHETTAPSCINGMDGKIVLRISGSARPYTVSWSDGGKGERRSELPAGKYIATVSDARGCVTQYTLDLGQGPSLQGALNIQAQATANAFRLSVLFADGSSPYAIQIKDLSQGVRATWGTYTGQTLSGGRYLVEAFTAAGCSQTGSINIQAN
jgi:hypothetical protein